MKRRKLTYGGLSQKLRRLGFHETVVKAEPPACGYRLYAYTHKGGNKAIVVLPLRRMDAKVSEMHKSMVRTVLQQHDIKDSKSFLRSLCPLCHP